MSQFLSFLKNNEACAEFMHRIKFVFFVVIKLKKIQSEFFFYVDQTGEHHQENAASNRRIST